MPNHDDSIDNKARAERMYHCMLSGDLPGFLAYVADDVTTHQSPALPYGGVYRGKAALQKLLSETVFPLIEGEKIQMVAPVIAGDDRVIGSFTVPSRRTGKVLQLLEQATFQNGKVVEFRVFYFDPTMM